MAASILEWSQYIDQYRNTGLRAEIFKEMVCSEVLRFQSPTVLDIGCGKGFDGNVALQKEIASLANAYIGIEPDETIQVTTSFDELHRCFFEQAPLTSSSIHVAFAVFVLEHIADPKSFWESVHRVLAPGGVFLGFTVDVRHYFATMSRTLERLNLKNWYLQKLRGERGTERYENYPTFYAANSPRRIRKFTAEFSQCSLASIHRPGQLKYYFPKALEGIGELIDRFTIAVGLPGSILIVRLQK